MRSAPTVARVLLVAHAARRRELSGWLRVRGEDAGYELHTVGPEVQLPLDPLYDVIVVDGESVREGGARRRLLRGLTRSPREGAVLFVCSTLSDGEIEDARLADDCVYSGWAQGDHVQRRVQLVALAAWRRSSAVRRRAEGQGSHLRAVPCREHASGITQAAAADARLVADAFQEGRRAATVDIGRIVDRTCAEILDEVVASRACPMAANDIEEEYAGVQAPVVAARFAGVTSAVEVLWGALRGVIQKELASLERVGGE